MQSIYMKGSNTSDFKFLVDKYNENLKKFGPNNSAVGWKSGKVEERFNLLMEDIHDYKTVLDIGCGIGLLNEYLKNKNINYTGLDINSEFINFCKKKFPNSQFILENELIPKFNKKMDVVVLSGLLNTPLKNNTDFTRRILKKSIELSNKFITFNFLSLDVDYKDKKLNYTSTSEIINFLESFSKRIIIKKSEILFETTITVELK